MRTLLTLLLAFGTAAYAQVLGPQRYLPGDDALAAAAFNQQFADVERGGGQYLTVWMDYRTGGDHLILDEGGADVYAARLDASGNLLDAPPILITAGAGDDAQPKATWNGTHWLVTWVAQVRTQFFWADAIRAVRVSPSGQVLDPQPLAVFDYSSSSGIDYDVASDGTNWAVAVRGTQGGDSDVKGLRVGPDGTVLAPGVVQLVSGDFSLTFFHNLVFAGDEYLLSYIHHGDVRGRRFSATLQPLDASPRTFVAGEFEALHAASDGTDFYLVWRQYLSGPQTAEVRGARIDHAGNVLDPGGDLIFQGFGGGDAPRVAWDGTNWFVTFRASGVFDGGYYAVRVSPAGTVLDPGGVEVFDDHFAFDPEVAARPGGGVQVVYHDDPAGGPTPWDVFTRTITPALAASPAVVVPTSAPAQVLSDVATSGSGYLVVYRSEVSGQRTLMAHPLGADGTPLLPAPVALASGPALSGPEVAFDGTRYLVVWAAPGGVFGRRVAPDGTFLDAAPFFVMNGFGPDVAANAGTFLVVDIQFGFSAEIQLPYAVRVDGATGTVLGAPVNVGFNHTRHVSAVGTGTRWLVAYQRNFSHDDPNAEVRANFVEADGTAGADFGVAGGLNPYNYRPEVAWSGADGLVVFYDANSDRDAVYGARVFPNKTTSPSFTVADFNDEQNFPAVAWDGEQYVTLYEDLREVTFFLDERSDVYGTRVTAGGTVLDPAGFEVFGDPLSEVDAAVTGAGGVALLAASDFLEAAPYAAYRIAYRFLGAPPAAVAVSADPVGGPIVIGPGGGSFQYTVTLTNTTAQPQSFQAWTAVTGPVSREPVLGPLPVTLQPGQTLTRTLTQRVPANAPAGAYTYHVRLGTFGGTVLASDSFTFTKEGSALAARGGTEAWSVSGWDEAAVASSSLPGGFALSEAAPNPFGGQTRLTLEVVEAQHVRARVYDALGRRVAVLLEGRVEAGAHALTLDGSQLPAGVYVVRVTGETFSATRRATLSR